MAGEGGRGGPAILKHENARHVSFLNPAAPLDMPEKMRFIDV